jgi:hypothetical protein
MKNTEKASFVAVQLEHDEILFALWRPGGVMVILSFLFFVHFCFHSLGLSPHLLFFLVLFIKQMIPVDRTTTAKDVRKKILENMSHSLSDSESEEKIKEYVFWWSIVECGNPSEGSRGDEKKEEKEKAKARDQNERRVEWDERVWGWRLGNKMGSTLYFKICYK